MSRATKSEEALIGYKLKVGDYVVVTTPFNLEKAYQVTKVTSKLAVCKVGNGRADMRFPRYYHLPFLPLQNKRSNYTSNNKWTVRVNDTHVKRKLKL